MAARKQQTHAKRARELAVKERRERKRAKKAEAAAQRGTDAGPAADSSSGVAGAEGHADIAAPEWIR
jgi:hypothetical protein